MNVSCEETDVETSEGRFGAYLAAPADAGHVAIVVLQEIFGVNANIRGIVDDFAANGYPAMAPDLFWRQGSGIALDSATTEGRERAMELLKGLRLEQSVLDAAAAVRALRERFPAVSRIAAVGYCYGGGVAFLMAARGVVDAGISYYGTGIAAMLGELDGLEKRLLLHVAKDDHVCPPEAQEAIKTAATVTRGLMEVVNYPGVGHAFARKGAASYDATAAAKADRLTFAELEALRA